MEYNYSEKWKKRGDRTAMLRNAVLKSMGYTDKDIEKPIIGIINTWAETNPGHVHFRQLSEAVKRGVWAAGGFPLEVNTLSICEVFFDISNLVYRNLLSITTEELIARHPFDGVVLIGGCDKNVPAQLMAAGGSTNLIIHLIAIAKRANIDLKLMDFEEISDETPLLVNVKPHGTESVGTGFHNAGGVASLMKEMEGMLDLDCLTATGKSLGENLKDIDLPYDQNIIRPLDNPLSEKGGISVLYGNLAPKGAVIKRSAASPHLLNHRGEARVFDDLEECQKYLLDDNSDMDENKVVVLMGYGPVGAPGMPENGNFMPLPPKLNKQGITDFVRITDSRMSGGCFGTQVLHVAPESAVGGTLAAVRDGDIIHIDVDNNLLELEISDEKLAERLKNVKKKVHPDIKRGFVRNFIDNVTQADEGCDLTYMQYVEE